MFEQLKDQSRLFYEEVWNQGKLETIEKFLDPGFVLYDPTAPGGEIRGFDGFKLYVTTFRSAFPDLRFKIDDVMVEGDKVAIRWTATGTHKGEFMGIKPTGKFGTVTGITYSKYIEDKVLESYVSKDDLRMFQLIGVVPTELFKVATPV